ncbi:4ff31dab-7752-4ba1-acbd-04d39db14f50 [Sclerotinia trifoliorum]|uniref:4ff31dab-7752-4ba1-acbd-04d39db14f50 n=1 Tax=Sclerotinia trifoliorum TaxID=28548 RepID=A0A8H2W1N8_9HELO|nr:4ff31dab-7752-4ba1-acbd-04d39db14f50 [Sclerotinia trifoliorum]
MDSHKHPINQSSKPIRHPTRKRLCSKDRTPMEDLTTIIEDQEANIEDLNLRLSMMEKRTKDLEDALMRLDTIDHSSRVPENEMRNQGDEGVEVVQKQQKSADFLRKKKKMYRALGLNPNTVGF